MDEQRTAPAGTTVFTGTLYRIRKGHGIKLTETPPRGPIRHPARVAITLALAHKLQQAIDTGVVTDRAEVARRLGLTRARVTQIMNLLLLPVAEQERLLFLEAVDGREPLSDCSLQGQHVVPELALRSSR